MALKLEKLRNKDTGVDLSVTGFRELPGLMRSTYEYQIVVVSNLSCFKLPSHKDSDVVQFTLYKKFPDCEDLRAKLNEAFSGTAMPHIVKKSIIVNDAVIKERRNSLDSFMKFLAATPRIVTSSQVLAFLGVEAQKAKRYASGETEELAAKEKGAGEGGEGDSAKNDEDESQGEKSASNLFEEEEEEEVEDFLTAANPDAGAEDSDDDFFSAADSSRTPASQARLFESQDLKRELTEDDEKDFTFIPDAIITKREVTSATNDDSNEDLLNVDEDIDFEKLLTLEGESKKQEHCSQPQPQDTNPVPPPTKPTTPHKPSIPTKPTPGPKPTTDKPNPKPTVPAKPSADSPKPKPRVPSKPQTSPTEKAKPVPAERPKPAPRKLKPQNADSGKNAEGGKTSREASRNNPTKPDLSSDDIMQYIAANAEEDDADLDLFS
ncbi:HCLS1-binding protein 3-like [Littorina saxatilis]|uniref:HCLS1-binding protein 3-like n=1 Tax=Littorina saxatilis TaxID=31220 RepID=UPI0038B42BE7